MLNNKETWHKGEAGAAKFLTKLKYKILEKNFTTKVGEIDIIAKIDGVYVFVEVKARLSEKYGLPREAVTMAKQSKIRRVAQEYLISKNDYPSLMRFDVIEILGESITHIIDAF